VITIPKLIPLDINKLKQTSEKPNRSRRRATRKLNILRRDNYKCVTCGIGENLTIAHLNPIRASNRGASHFKLNECKTQCIDCHITEEFGQIYKSE